MEDKYHSQLKSAVNILYDLSQMYIVGINI
jgi:hypothetical protein